jgi:hypothetical protein
MMPGLLFYKTYIMKLTQTCLCFIFLLLKIHGQTPDQHRNIFIITTDGFRWEELFTGADSSLLSDARYVKDIPLTREMFWDNILAVRRQKLMPFFWNVISKQGQLYGNRLLNNKVDVKNVYKISYPGYNEILTGFADPNPNFNSAVLNRNTNLLEYLNQQPAFRGSVVAFSSWNLIPYILNEQRGGFPVNSGYEQLDAADLAARQIDSVQANQTEKGRTRHDLLTYLSARQFIEAHHPKAMFLSFGETDECAHLGRYDLYLQKAASFDKMLADLWYYLQTDPFYKGNTTLIITTDHGRGKKGSAWRTHGFWVKGSGQVWLAMLGPDILPRGEMAAASQIWQRQIASTAAVLAGTVFVPGHRVGLPIHLPR